MKFVAVTTPAWQCSCDPLRCGIPIASAFRSTGLYMESVTQSCTDIVPRTLTTTARRATSRAMKYGCSPTPFVKET